MSSNCATCSAPVTVRRTETVGARVTTTQDDHVLAGGQELVGHGVARDRRLFCCGRNSIAKMDALEFASLDGQVARLGGAAGEHHRIELLVQLVPP